VPPSVISGTGRYKFVPSAVSHPTPYYRLISTFLTAGNQSSRIEMKVATTRERTIRFFLRLDTVCCRKWLEKKHDVLQMIGYYIIYIPLSRHTLYRYEWKIVFLSCIVCRIIIELSSRNYYILHV